MRFKGFKYYLPAYLGVGQSKKRKGSMNCNKSSYEYIMKSAHNVPLATIVKIVSLVSHPLQFSTQIYLLNTTFCIIIIRLAQSDFFK